MRRGWRRADSASGRAGARDFVCKRTLHHLVSVVAVLEASAALARFLIKTSAISFNRKRVCSTLDAAGVNVLPNRDHIVDDGLNIMLNRAPCA